MFLYVIVPEMVGLDSDLACDGQPYLLPVKVGHSLLVERL